MLWSWFAMLVAPTPSLDVVVQIYLKIIISTQNTKERRKTYLILGTQLRLAVPGVDVGSGRGLLILVVPIWYTYPNCK
jgi:hypothetical protein